ncbi:molecular chaperone [Chitinophaga flava]|uniref:Molecular chaperone n=1 Tax=Chitinophaga flava TaxID=2259036 RepID=A0A365XVZ9_9BACT|nr:molecular chaperone [Chitinophaga flava]
MIFSAIFKKLIQCPFQRCAVAFSVVWILISLLVSGKVNAQGNLMIYPKRVVFDGTKRTQDLGLANTGVDTATYLISFIQIKMNEDGTFKNVEQPDSGQNFASNYLRVYPRTITIPPKESQAVKLQVANAGNLPPGEYRSHIYFRAVPPPVPAGEKQIVKDSASLEVKLVPIFGITIPVIIQIGESTTTATISDIAVDFNDPAKPQALMYLNRTGNMSAYGDLTVDYVSSNGQKIRAAAIKGVAVYTPLQRRKVRLDLDASSKIDYHQGRLEVSYESSNGKAPVSLAKQELVLK